MLLASSRQEPPASPSCRLLLLLPAITYCSPIHPPSCCPQALAFEAMRSNQQLIRSSICHSAAALAPRLLMHPFGLGAARGHCHVFSDEDNRGDGITMCGMNSTAEAAAKVPKGYALRGRMDVERLSDVVQRDVQVRRLEHTTSRTIYLL